MMRVRGCVTTFYRDMGYEKGLGLWVIYLIRTMP